MNKTKSRAALSWHTGFNQAFDNEHGKINTFETAYLQRGSVRNKISFIFLLISLSLGGARGQEVEKRLTRTIRGIVTDAASGVTIPFATISLAEMPEQVAVSDGAGRGNRCRCGFRSTHPPRQRFVVYCELPLFDDGIDYPARFDGHARARDELSGFEF